MKSVQKMNDLLEKRDKVERKRNNNTSSGSNSFMGRVRNVGGATKFSNFDIAQAINSGATLGIKNDEMEKYVAASSNLEQALGCEFDSC